MVKLTLKQCAYFIAVAEQGGIAQASRVLNISQPAVAQAISKLEDLYGLRLFERHHALGTELTPHGRSFMSAARNLLQQAERAEHEAKAISANLAGTIRLGCFHTISPFYLPQLIRKFTAAYPNINIVATELRQDEILSAMERREIDLALTYDMSINPASVAQKTVVKLKPFMLLSESHRYASRASISLKDMADEPYVMFDGPSSREYFESILKTHGISPPISFNATSMESVRSAVANGLGFSLSVMKLENADSYAGDPIVSVPIFEHVNDLAVVLIRTRSLLDSVLLNNFSDFCEAHFANYVADS
jgi:DNA-binding transcriptional LysR family regulator